MNTEYDFTQNINTPQLLDEINTAGLPAPAYITTSGNEIAIFYASPLTSDQQTTLSAVVANHVANPNYISLAQQAQITTLTNYLNNTATANTARAAILANLGPSLPLNTLIAINTAIHAATGS